MYTEKNFRSKKELKAAVEANLILNRAIYHLVPDANSSPEGIPVAHAIQIMARLTPAPVRYYQPGPFGGNEPKDGTFCCEGPHYPEPHKWYATCTAKDGVIIKVK